MSSNEVVWNESLEAAIGIVVVSTSGSIGAGFGAS